MKLVTFTHDGNTHIGVLQTRDRRQTVVSLNEQDPSLPYDLIEFLAGGAAMRSRAEKALAKTRKVFDIGEVALKAPIPRPGKIMCVGLNYRDHAAEGGHEVPQYPTIFAKYNNCVIGPYDPIVIPRVTDQIDWEGEFGFVIGKRARYVPEDEALDYVAGYVCFNDVSARDYQMRTSQWLLGKTLDKFLPIGPYLVTADSVPDPQALALRTWLNGAPKRPDIIGAVVLPHRIRRGVLEVQSCSGICRPDNKLISPACPGF